MSNLFEKMTPAAREIAETKLRAKGHLAPDAPLEYAFKDLPSDRSPHAKSLRCIQRPNCDLQG